MTRAEFTAAVDWAAVRAGVTEARAELDHLISQRRAELAAGVFADWLTGLPGTRRDSDPGVRRQFQELLASYQDNIDACEELLAVIDGVRAGDDDG